jgi:hypothetical protein
MESSPPPELSVVGVPKFVLVTLIAVPASPRFASSSSRPP